MYFDKLLLSPYTPDRLISQQSCLFHLTIGQVDKIKETKTFRLFFLIFIICVTQIQITNWPQNKFLDKNVLFKKKRFMCLCLFNLYSELTIVLQTKQKTNKNRKPCPDIWIGAYVAV